jgi:hypothetical protein
VSRMRAMRKIEAQVGRAIGMDRLRRGWDRGRNDARSPRSCPASHAV